MRSRRRCRRRAPSSLVVVAVVVVAAVVAGKPCPGAKPAGGAWRVGPDVLAVRSRRWPSRSRSRRRRRRARGRRRRRRARRHAPPRRGGGRAWTVLRGRRPAVLRRYDGLGGCRRRCRRRGRGRRRIAGDASASGAGCRRRWAPTGCRWGSRSCLRVCAARLVGRVGVACALPVNPRSPFAVKGGRARVRNNPPHVRDQPLRPAHRPLARADRVVLVVTLAVLTAVLVGVGWLITHPLKSTMAHENSVNRWFVDQRTSGLTDVADIGTFIGQTLTGAVVLVVLGVVLRGVEAHLVAAGVRRRPRRRARPVLPGRHDARPAAAAAGAHPAVGAGARPQLPVGPHRHRRRASPSRRPRCSGPTPACRRRCSWCWW